MISIIIPTCKPRSLLPQIVEKLDFQTKKIKTKVELIIVKDTLERFEELEKIKESSNNLEIYIFSQPHQGPAQARNLGIKKGRGQIICFLDDDSVPSREWLFQIVDSFETESADIVSGKILSLIRDTNSFPYLLEKSVYVPQKRFATCNIAYKREVFKKVGLFDARFKLASWEDNDLGVRARLKGFKHVYNKKAVVFHSHEENLQEFKEKCIRNGRGLCVFTKKYLFKYPHLVTFFLFLTFKGIFWVNFAFLFKGRLKEIFYLKFLWSWYSLKGFIKEWFRK